MGSTYAHSSTFSSAVAWTLTQRTMAGRARLRRVRWVLGESWWRFREQMRWALESPRYYPPLPTVECPECGRGGRSLTPNGKIVRHDDPRTPGTRCEGSGQIMRIDVVV